MSSSFVSVVFPVLLGTVVIALMQVVKRMVMKDGAISSLQCLILYYAAATMIFGAVYLFLWGLTLPQVLPGMWTAVFLGASVNTLIQFFNVKAASIDKGEVSLTAPLQAMTPGLITGLAFLLGEYPSRIGILGIGCMALGSYVLLWDTAPQHWYEYLGPVKRLILLLRLGQLSREERNKTIVVTLALGSACMGTVGLLFDGLYARRALTMQGLVLASTGVTIFLFSAYSIWYAMRPDAGSLKVFSGAAARATIILIIVMGILWALHVVTIFPAYQKTFVAYIGTLKRFSILMSVIMGFLFFREAEFKKRLWAALFIIAGAMLIATDDLPTRLATKIEGFGI